MKVLKENNDFPESGSFTFKSWYFYLEFLGEDGSGKTPFSIKGIETISSSLGYTYSANGILDLQFFNDGIQVSDRKGKFNFFIPVSNKAQVEVDDVEIVGIATISDRGNGYSLEIIS
jgi:hypothetical protein